MNETKTGLPQLNKNSTDRDMALKFMEEIMYDNGWVNRLEYERFSPKWTKKIAPVAGNFFRSNPELLSDETVDEIAIGEGGEVERQFGLFDGFKLLTDVLNEYFDDGGQS